jgi:hypothetical protein
MQDEGATHGPDRGRTPQVAPLLEEEFARSERELPAEKRVQLRERLLAETPGWYSPVAHLTGSTVFGLSIAVLAGLLLDGVRWWDWLAVPASFVIANFLEWHAHRDLLHKRQWWLPVLYDRHTPIHHLVFVSHDMAILERREWRQVLIPASGVALIVVMLFPVCAVIWLVGLPNMAILALITNIGYVLSYEWLHLSYHLSPESWIGRRRLIRFLGRHHAVHHAPSLMRRWNMNVTVPLWDWLRGSIADPAQTKAALTGPEASEGSD